LQPLTVDYERPGRLGLLTWLTSRGKRKAVLTLAVPRDCRVELEVVSASLMAGGLRAPVLAKTVSGEITLAGLGGAAEAETVSGAVQASAISGDLSAATVSGEITVAEGGGSVQAGPSRGDRHRPRASGTGTSSCRASRATSPSTCRGKRPGGQAPVALRPGGQRLPGSWSSTGPRAGTRPEGGWAAAPAGSGVSTSGHVALPRRSPGELMGRRVWGFQGCPNESVFSHGRLRLYLLSCWRRGQRHGYDVIRLLEDRFMGLYAPSPGTIYPRLQRLEAEGLVTQTKEGGRKVYQITDAGRAELAARHDELDELEAEISGSVHGMAREIRDEVRGTVHNLKQELKQAAREIRREQRHENRSRRDQGGDQRWDWYDQSVDGRLWYFLDRTQKAIRRAQLTEAQVRECAAILDEALERIRNVLKQSPDTEEGSR
jgi:DNA-binding PadR family transcriptional regulator